MPTTIQGPHDRPPSPNDTEMSPGGERRSKARGRNFDAVVVLLTADAVSRFVVHRHRLSPLGDGGGLMHQRLTTGRMASHERCKGLAFISKRSGSGVNAMLPGPSEFCYRDER